MRYLLIFSLLSYSLAAAAIDITSTNDATQLIQKLLDDPQACLTGSSVSNCTYTGPDEATALFSDGNSSGFELDTGVLLSTGKAADAVGPNLNGGKTFNYNTSGDVSLNDLTSAGETRDAVVLEFDFQARGEILTMQYIFASEEYNEFANSEFNDVFGFFLNDVTTPDDVTNIGTVNGSPVSINTINKGSSQFVNNAFEDFDNEIAPFATEYDGFTKIIQANANLTAGSTYHMKIAIADVRDSGFDSAVLLNGFATIPPEIQVFDANTELFDAASTVDFGTTTLGTTVVKTLTVINSGAVDAADLTLSNPQLPSGFSLLTSPLPNVTQGLSQTIQIQLDASSAGTFNGTLNITTNDVDENPFDLTLSGEVVATSAGFTASVNGQVVNNNDSIDFGSITEGASSSRTVVVQNTGSAALQLSGASVSGDYVLASFPADPIAPNSSASIILQLGNSTVGTHQGIFTLNSNASNATTFSLNLTAQVNAVTPIVSTPVESKNIPTLTEWAMILLSGLLLLIGWQFVPQRMV